MEAGVSEAVGAGITAGTMPEWWHARTPRACIAMQHHAAVTAGTHPLMLGGAAVCTTVKRISME